MDTTIFETFLYFLAIINPISKVFVLVSSIESGTCFKKITMLSLKATCVATIILIPLPIAGNYIFQNLFHVDIYSLRIAGGVVIFTIGMTAIRKGRFYDKNLRGGVDISIVPLGAPLIAGPGIIAASIAFSSSHGGIITVTALALAIWINFIIMLFSKWIGDFLNKVCATGPLIRITGLIVAAVAVQMMLTGVGTWLGNILITALKITAK